MPLYEFKNIETGKTIELVMTISAREIFLKENPNLQPVLSAPKIISMHGSTIGKTSDGWKDLLKATKKGSGQGNTINV